MRADLFIGAQAVVLETALSEMRAGKKATHWIWCVFPQHVELGHSGRAKLFGLATEDVEPYWRHPVLGVNLWKAATVAMAHRPDLGPIDTIKLQSCLTLFARVTRDPLFYNALHALYGDEQCVLTKRVLMRVVEDREEPPANERFGQGICSTGTCDEPCGPNGGCIR